MDDLGRQYGQLNLQGRSDRINQLAHITLLDGKNDTYVGLNAGASRPLVGGNNTYVGAYSGANAISEASTFLGYASGRRAQRIKESAFFGFKSGEVADRVQSSVCVGAYSGRKMTRANNNTIVGYQAGAELTSGSRNVALGSYAAFHQFNGHDNVCIGHRSGYKNEIGANNCFVGTNSGFSAYAGYDNVCMGVGSGENLLTGTKNVLVGHLSGASISNASNCIAIGTRSMEFFSKGDTNTCLGTQTARRLMGNNNTILGGYAAGNTEGSFNTIVGSSSINRRNDWKILMDSSVVVGEDVVIDVPILTANIAYSGAIQQSALPSVDPDIYIVLDAGLSANANILGFMDDMGERTTSVGAATRSNVFYKIDMSPTGDILLPYERYLRLGGSWTADMGNNNFQFIQNNGVYRITWDFYSDEVRYSRCPRYEVYAEPGPCPHLHVCTHDEDFMPFDWRYQDYLFSAVDFNISVATSEVVAGVITVYCAGPQTGMGPGSWVTVWQADDSRLDGTWQLAAGSTDTVFIIDTPFVDLSAATVGYSTEFCRGYPEYAHAVSAIQTTQTGNDLSCQLVLGSSDFAAGHAAVILTDQRALAVQSLSAAGSTITVTTSQPHALVTGDWIRVKNYAAPGANGTFAISRVSDTAVTYVAHVQVPSGTLAPGVASSVVQTYPWHGDHAVIQALITLDGPAIVITVPDAQYAGSVPAAGGGTQVYWNYRRQTNDAAYSGNDYYYSNLKIDSKVVFGLCAPKSVSTFFGTIVSALSARVEMDNAGGPQLRVSLDGSTTNVYGSIELYDPVTADNLFRVLPGTFVPIAVNLATVLSGRAVLLTTHQLCQGNSAEILEIVDAYERMLESTPDVAERSPEYMHYVNHALMVPGSQVYLEGSITPWFNGFFTVEEVSEQGGGTVFSVDVSHLKLADGEYSLGYAAKTYLSRVDFMRYQPDGLRLYRSTDPDFPPGVSVTANPRRVYAYVKRGHGLEVGQYLSFQGCVDERFHDKKFTVLATPGYDETYAPTVDDVPVPRWNADYTGAGTDCWLVFDIDFDVSAGEVLMDVVGSQVIMYTSHFDRDQTYVEIEGYANSASSMQMITPDNDSSIAGVQYSARSDITPNNILIAGPSVGDGHQHSGFGSQLTMDANIASGVLEFTDAGYSKAIYTVGLSTLIAAGGVFELPAGNVSLGLNWLGQYTLELSKRANLLDVFVTSTSTTLTTQNVAEVSHAVVSLEGSVSGDTLPCDIAGIMALPDHSANLSFAHSLTSNTLDISLVLEGTDGNIMNTVTKVLGLHILDVPPADFGASTVEYYANAFTTLSNIGLSATGYYPGPVISNVVYLGSSHTVILEEDRQNVLIVSLGPNRLIRGNADVFDIYSNRVGMRAMSLSGNLNGWTMTVASFPSGAMPGLHPVGNLALDVTGIVRASETLMVQANYYGALLQPALFVSPGTGTALDKRLFVGPEKPALLVRANASQVDVFGNLNVLEYDGVYSGPAANVSLVYQDWTTTFPYYLDTWGVATASAPYRPEVQGSGTYVLFEDDQYVSWPSLSWPLDTNGGVAFLMYVYFEPNPAIGWHVASFSEGTSGIKIYGDVSTRDIVVEYDDSILITAPLALAPGTWQLVGITLDAQHARIWVDGAETVKETQFSVTLQDFTTSLNFVGGYPAYPGYASTHMRLREFRAYARALTETEFEQALRSFQKKFRGRVGARVTANAITLGGVDLGTALANLQSQIGGTLTPSRALVSNATGVITSSAVKSSTLDYLDVTSSVQTQLDNATGNITTLQGRVGPAYTPSRVLVSNATGVIANSAVTSTTLAYLDASSSVQTQLDGKLSRAVDAWNTSSDNNNRYYFASSNRTYWSSLGGFEWRYNTSTTIGSLDTSGNFAVPGNMTAYSSDKRLKANMRPICESALDAVCALNGVRFEWTNDAPEAMRGATDVSLLAQDVLQVLPEAVAPAPFDIDPATGESLSGERYLTLRMHHQLTALLVEAIKELRAEIKELRGL